MRAFPLIGVPHSYSIWSVDAIRLFVFAIGGTIACTDIDLRLFLFVLCFPLQLLLLVRMQCC